MTQLIVMKHAYNPETIWLLLYNIAILYTVCIGWQWRNSFIPHLYQLLFRYDVGQALQNVCYCDITFLVT